MKILRIDEEVNKIDINIVNGKFEARKENIVAAINCDSLCLTF